MRLLKTLMIALSLSATTAYSSEEVTVVSYNIRHGADIDFTLNLNGTERVLRRLQADVIALQEVDKGCKRSEGVDQARELGENLGMYSAFGKFMDLGEGEYGMALLSKYPIIEKKLYELPLGAEPRVALEIVTEPRKGVKVSFVCIHLDWTSEEIRLKQAKALIEALSVRQHPVVLVGDFNAEPNSATMKLLNSVWKNVPKGKRRYTFPANSPNLEIDYIMTRGLPKTEEKCQVVEEVKASDHRPLRVVLPLL